jgi:hypothetical protein
LEVQNVSREGTISASPIRIPHLKFGSLRNPENPVNPVYSVHVSGIVERMVGGSGVQLEASDGAIACRRGGRFGGVRNRGSRGGRTRLVQTHQFLMKTQHAAVKEKQPQLEMKHLQPATKQFQLETEHFRSTANIAPRKHCSQAAITIRGADIAGGSPSLQDFPPLSCIFQHALAQGRDGRRAVTQHFIMEPLE